MTQKDIIEKFNLKINFNDPHKIQNHDKIHYENTIIELEDELNVLRKSLVDFYLQVCQYIYIYIYRYLQNLRRVS